MKDCLLRWGILSVGKISNDFVLALSSLDAKEHKVCAVSARNLDRANEFAKQHSIPKAYGSYTEFAKDPDIDVVYVGSINIQHFEICKMLLEAGKPILCEKPLCVNVDETVKLFKIAKEKNLFLMEGLWSRFFPVYKKAREIIDAGTIGEVQLVQSTFGILAESVERVSKKELGGGAMLDIGVYGIQFAQFIYNEKPFEQTTSGFLHKTGVDKSSSIVLKYSNQRSAVLSYSMGCQFPNEAIICGSKGMIKICYRFWCPTKLELSHNYEEPTVFEFKLPTDPPQEKFVYADSIGLRYQAIEVRRCIMEGMLESPTVSHNSTIEIAEILQQARKDLGYVLAQDAK